MDLGFYFRIFLRRSPWLVFFLVAGTLAGVSLALVMPPVYESQATLIVESEQIDRNLATSTVRTPASEQVQILQQRILSREVLLEMANRLKIYPAGNTMPADEKVADMRSRIGISLRGGATRRGKQANILTISYASDDADMAARVANEVVTLMLQENVKIRTTVSGQTLEFFSQEEERLSTEMSQLSAKILAFKEQNIDALPDSLDFRRSQQAGVQERLVQMDRSEASLTDRRERLVELFEDTGFVPSDPNRKPSVEEQQLAKLRREMASSVVVLSKDNPKVAVKRAQIAALEKIVAEQQAERSAALSEAFSGEDGDGAPPTPFEIQLADIDAQLALVARRRGELEQRMEELTATIKATPGNAVVLESMQREFNNLRSRYNEAVTSKARAETGDMIETLSKGQRISIVDQAVAPTAPTSPNRPMVAAAGVGGGAAIGLAIIALLELLNKTVRRPIEISNRLGITALATIPYIKTRRQIVAQRLSVLAAVVATVAMIGGGLWLIDQKVIPLDQAIERIMSAVEPRPTPSFGPAVTQSA